MATIALPDVGEIVDAVRIGVERRLGKKRRLYTAEDLIDDVGLTPEQFDDLIDELQRELSVEIDPDTSDQLTVAGALVVRLLHLCRKEVGGEDLEAA
jgi:hypothetical protein